jgi:branched-chain amino acid transport system ATP-binding protein
MSEAAKPIFELSGASTGYGGIEAIHDVSLKVMPGQVTAIVGVNGAGKSTTLSLMAGLLPLTGEAWFRGEPCRRKARRVIRPGIALSPEGRRLFPQMSVEENLLSGAYKTGREGIAERLERVYETFPRLAERRTQAGGSLSGGEQQMAAIGRALMSDPSLLLLDEPTLGLAPKMGAAVGELIEEIAATGMTIVLVEQDVHMALELAAYGYVLSTGRVIEEGTSAALKEGAYLGGGLLTTETAG